MHKYSTLQLITDDFISLYFILCVFEAAVLCILHIIATISRMGIKAIKSTNISEIYTGHYLQLVLIMMCNKTVQIS